MDKGKFNINSNETFTGTVLWFSDAKGFGFIETSEMRIGTSNASVFAHYSHINNGESFKTLSKGQIVSFEISEVVKGEITKLQAINIREKQIIKAKATIINS